MNPDTKLSGANNHESALIDQWIDFHHTTLTKPFWPILSATFGWQPIDKETYNEGIKSLKGAMTVLNTHL